MSRTGGYEIAQADKLIEGQNFFEAAKAILLETIQGSYFLEFGKPITIEGMIYERTLDGINVRPFNPSPLEGYVWISKVGNGVLGESTPLITQALGSVEYPAYVYAINAKNISDASQKELLDTLTEGNVIIESYNVEVMNESVTFWGLETVERSDVHGGSPGESYVTDDKKVLWNKAQGYTGWNPGCVESYEGGQYVYRYIYALIPFEKLDLYKDHPFTDTEYWGGIITTVPYTEIPDDE